MILRDVDIKCVLNKIDLGCIDQLNTRQIFSIDSADDAEIRRTHLLRLVTDVNQRDLAPALLSQKGVKLCKKHRQIFATLRGKYGDTLLFDMIVN